MHELELARRVIELATAAVSDKSPNPVAMVHLQIGELAGVNPEALAFAFDALKAGTPLRGAELAFELVPVRFCCSGCGAICNPGGELRCRRCGDSPCKLRSGTELELTAVTLGEVGETP